MVLVRKDMDLSGTCLFKRDASGVENISRYECKVVTRVFKNFKGDVLAKVCYNDRCYGANALDN